MARDSLFIPPDESALGPPSGVASQSDDGENIIVAAGARRHVPPTRKGSNWKSRRTVADSDDEDYIIESTHQDVPPQRKRFNPPRAKRRHESDSDEGLILESAPTTTYSTSHAGRKKRKCAPDSFQVAQDFEIDELEDVTVDDDSYNEELTDDSVEHLELEPEPRRTTRSTAVSTRRSQRKTAPTFFRGAQTSEHGGSDFEDDDDEVEKGDGVYKDSGEEDEAASDGSDGTEEELDDAMEEEVDEEVDAELDEEMDAELDEEMDAELDADEEADSNARRRPLVPTMINNMRSRQGTAKSRPKVLKNSEDLASNSEESEEDYTEPTTNASLLTSDDPALDVAPHSSQNGFHAQTDHTKSPQGASSLPAYVAPVASATTTVTTPALPGTSGRSDVEVAVALFQQNVTRNMQIQWEKILDLEQQLEAKDIEVEKIREETKLELREVKDARGLLSQENSRLKDENEMGLEAMAKELYSEPDYHELYRDLKEIHIKRAENLEKKVKSLKMEVAKWKAKNNSHEEGTTFRNLTNKIAKLKEKLEDTDATLKEKDRSIHARDEKLEEKEAIIDRKTDQLKEKRNECQKKDRQLKKLEGEIEKKDSELAEAQAGNEEEHQLAEAQEEIQRKDRKLKELMDEIEKKDNELAQAQAEKAEKDRELSDLRRRVKKSTKRVPIFDSDEE